MPDAPPPTPDRPAAITAERGKPIRLHIGGETVREGWKILNIQAKPGVDFIGTATDLSQFADRSITEIYASHIYEHLDHAEFITAIIEAFRVLKPGGLLRAGVPDLEVLCRLMLDKALSVDEKYMLTFMFYGGHLDAFDYHKIGFTFEILGDMLYQAGFREIKRMPSFGLFNDTSEQVSHGHRISLNVMAMKPL